MHLQNLVTAGGRAQNVQDTHDCQVWVATRDPQLGTPAAKGRAAVQPVSCRHAVHPPEMLRHHLQLCRSLQHNLLPEARHLLLLEATAQSNSTFTEQVLLLNAAGNRG